MCLEISNWATAHAFFNLYHSLFLRLDNFNYQLCYMVMNRETVICIFLVILLKLSCYYINDQEPNTWSKAHCLINQLLMTTWFNINHSFFFFLLAVVSIMITCSVGPATAILHIHYLLSLIWNTDTIQVFLIVYSPLGHTGTIYWLVLFKTDQTFMMIWPNLLEKYKHSDCDCLTRKAKKKTEITL
jgi:hypothetical protein